MKASDTHIYQCYLQFSNQGQFSQQKFTIYDTYLTIQIGEANELKVEYCSQDVVFEWKLDDGNQCEVIVITENYSYTYRGSKQTIQNLKQYLDGKVFYGNFMSQYKEIQILKKTKQGEIIKYYSKHQNIEVIAKRLNFTQNLERHSKSLVLNELRICQYLSQFNQESILKLREFYQEKNKIILIFDYCEGGTLYSFMAQKNFCPSYVDIRKIMKKLLFAIKFLHKHNIMHRDIKMDNIMLLLNYLNFSFSQKLYVLNNQIYMINTYRIQDIILNFNEMKIIQLYQKITIRIQFKLLILDSLHLQMTNHISQKDVEPQVIQPQNSTLKIPMMS